jgi:hypothetical protein
VPPDSVETQNAQLQYVVVGKPRSVSPVGKPKSRARTNSTSKISKKSKKKVASPISTQPSFVESVFSIENNEGTSVVHSPNAEHQNAMTGYFSPTGTTSVSSPYIQGQRSLPTPVTTPITPLPSFQNFIHYESQLLDRSSKVPHFSGQQQQNHKSLGFSSRIEDVSGFTPLNHYPTLPEPQKVVRSQYIMATQDSMWRSSNDNR